MLLSTVDEKALLVCVRVSFALRGSVSGKVLVDGGILDNKDVGVVMSAAVV